MPTGDSATMEEYERYNDTGMYHIKSSKCLVQEHAFFHTLILL